MGTDLKLSEREVAILRYISLGLQSKEIAVKINRSKPTVELHVRMLCEKFRANSRAHLVACALQSGVISFAGDERIGEV